MYHNSRSRELMNIDKVSTCRTLLSTLRRLVEFYMSPQCGRAITHVNLIIIILEFLVALPCLCPSWCLRIGVHRHQGSPRASVFCPVNAIGNGYSCTSFDILCPTSPWSSLTSVTIQYNTIITFVERYLRSVQER